MLANKDISKDNRSGRDLKRIYDDYIVGVRAATEVEIDNELDYAKSHGAVERAFINLKAVTTAICDSGYLEAIEKIGNLTSDLLSVIGSISSSTFRDTVINISMKYFPVGKYFFETCPATDPAVYKSMLKSAMSQSDDPESLAAKALRTLGNDRSNEFLSVWLMSIAECTPPNKEFNTVELIVLFTELSEHLIKVKDKKSEAAMLISANIEIISPALGHFLEVVKDDDPFKREFVAARLPMDSALLVDIYTNTQDKNVRELAEFTINRPVNKMTYTHFDMIGVSRSPEWHFAEQEIAKGTGKRAALYQYAIITPGVRVNPDVLPAVDAWVIHDCIKAIESIPVTSDKEVCDKLQLVFDILVREASELDKNGVMKEIIAEAKLPKWLYKKHTHLLGHKFGSELGL